MNRGGWGHSDRASDAEEPALTPTLIAAAFAGLGGFVVFLVVHALWILPIWFIAAPGSVVAALGGAGAGWAYHEVRPRFRRPVGAILALLGLQLVAVAPAHALAMARGPLPPGFVTNPPGPFLLRVMTELLVGAAAIGAVAGAVMAPGRRRAAVATAAAAVGLAIGPGHNVPLLAAAPAAPKMWLLLGASILTAAVLFVPASRLLCPARLRPAGAAPHRMQTNGV
ncbi:MAG TPA: hypothetical protein VFX49_17505 [Chloroflexota bacterium]|nr:hypothetical protein [Chloroflexota bacterium]